MRLFDHLACLVLFEHCLEVANKENRNCAGFDSQLRHNVVSADTCEFISFVLHAATLGNCYRRKKQAKEQVEAGRSGHSGKKNGSAFVCHGQSLNVNQNIWWCSLVAKLLPAGDICRKWKSWRQESWESVRKKQWKSQRSCTHKDTSAIREPRQTSFRRNWISEAWYLIRYTTIVGEVNSTPHLCPVPRKM